MRKVRHVTYILQRAGLPLLNTLDQERVPLHVYFVLGQCRCKDWSKAGDPSAVIYI